MKTDIEIANEYPIVCQADEVRAILDGRQTQLRRLVNESAPADERVLERRVDVLDTLRRHHMPMTAGEIAAEIDETFEDVLADVEALQSVGIIRCSKGSWYLRESFADDALAAGIRVIAARAR